MRSIDSIREINREHLYSFYERLGEKAGYSSGMVASARTISNGGYSWPSYILGGGKMVKSSLLGIFRQMKEGSLPFFWLRLMDEDPEFENFASEHGIRKINLWKGMYMEKATPFKLPSPVPGLVFEELSTQNDLIDWLKVVNLEIMSHNELPASIFLNVLNDPDFRFFRVTNGKKTISTILMHKRNNVTGLYMLSTVLTERGKGIGRWTMTSAMDRLISEGCKEFVLHGTMMGYPIYLKLGFEECGEYGIFWMLGKK